MTADDRLESIRARAEKATKGPWRHDRQPIGSARLSTVSSGPLVDDGRPRFPVAERLLGRDGEFIAAAREDVPYLLGLLAEKDAMLTRLAEAGVTLGEECERLSAVATQQDATIQRMRHLHQSKDYGGFVMCPADGEAWPCSTIRALDGQEGA